MKISTKDMSIMGLAYDLSGNSFIVIDQKFNLKYINDYGRQLFGFQIKDILNGGSFEELLRNYQFPSLIDTQEKTAISKTVSIKNTLKQWKLIDATIDNQDVYFLLDNDVTEQEKMYALLESSVSEVTGQIFSQRLSPQEYMNEIRGCLESVIRQMPCYIYWKDKDFRYIFCNDFTVDIMGLDSRDEAIGKTDYDFGWDAKLVDTYRETDKRIINTGEPRLNFEEDLIDKNGNRIHTLVNKMPLRSHSGEIIGILGITVDITAAKEAEERGRAAIAEAAIATANAETSVLLSKTKAAAEVEMRKTVMVLVGDIVHDLRTPIATIRTICSILSMTIPPLLEIIDEDRELGGKKINLLSNKRLSYLRDHSPVTSLQSAVLMMDDFINSTLVELSNAQRAHEEDFTSINLTRCSSRRVLENTLEAYPFPENIIIHQNISYDFFLRGNSILLMKVLFNLFKNAVESITTKGKGEITVSSEDAGDKNVLKVKDTAGGALPEVMAKFFKPYFTTKEGGTGIGLAVSRKTMQIFGGDLSCDSVYGEHIEFTLSFPKCDDQ